MDSVEIMNHSGNYPGHISSKEFDHHDRDMDDEAGVEIDPTEEYYASKMPRGYDEP
jgi:hypothetical protein